MKKKILAMIMIFTFMVPTLGLAENFTQPSQQTVISSSENQFSQFTGNSSSQITKDKVDKTIDEAGTQVSNFAELILRQVADKSTPICALLLIYGAVLYFIMGIRNLYRKRQGMLMMWGSLTFWVIAQVAYVVFWLLGTKL